MNFKHDKRILAELKPKNRQTHIIVIPGHMKGKYKNSERCGRETDHHKQYRQLVSKKVITTNELFDIL